MILVSIIRILHSNVYSISNLQLRLEAQDDFLLLIFQGSIDIGIIFYLLIASWSFIDLHNYYKDN